MDQRVSFVTLIVRDLAASREFYAEGLGWEPIHDEAGEVLMFEVADKVVLSLWDESHAVEEIGPIGRGEGSPPFTLAHNLATPKGVDRVLEQARVCGAEVSDAVERAWGGYTGYFVDPDGFRWEIAHNPGPIGEGVLP